MRGLFSQAHTVRGLFSQAHTVRGLFSQAHTVRGLFSQAHTVREAFSLQNTQDAAVGYDISDADLDISTHDNFPTMTGNHEDVTQQSPNRNSIYES